MQVILFPGQATRRGRGPRITEQDEFISSPDGHLHYFGSGSGGCSALSASAGALARWRCTAAAARGHRGRRGLSPRRGRRGRRDTAALGRLTICTGCVPSLPSLPSVPTAAFSCSRGPPRDVPSRRARCSTCLAGPRGGAGRAAQPRAAASSASSAGANCSASQPLWTPYYSGIETSLSQGVSPLTYVVFPKS